MARRCLSHANWEVPRTGAATARAACAASPSGEIPNRTWSTASIEKTNVTPLRSGFEISVGDARGSPALGLSARAPVAIDSDLDVGAIHTSDGSRQGLVAHRPTGSSCTPTAGGE